MPVDTPDRNAGRLQPETVARKTFGTSFRGYDQLEVRGYLSELAEQLRLAVDREADLRTQIEAAHHRAAKAETIDESRFAEVLGAETAKVIMAAREAAAEIREKAEENVARLLREAQADAAQLRAEGDAEATRRIEEAESEVTATRKASDAIRADAMEAAAATLEGAKDEGRQMVAEAQAVRERVLQDLSRRRKAARQQIEQLRVGRDRLLEAYDVVRRTLEEATEELRVALPEARAAADAARDNELADVADPAEATDAAPEPEPETAEPGPEAEVDVVVVAVVDDSATVDVDALVEDTPLVNDAAPAEPIILARSGRVKRRRRPPEADLLPEAELTPLEPEAAFEGVRLVAVPDQPDEPTPGDDARPEDTAPEDAADAAAVEADLVEIIAVTVETDEEVPAEGDDVRSLFARLRAERGDDETESPAEAGTELEPVDAEPASDEEPAAVEARSLEAEALLARRDAVTDDAERRLARRLKRVLSDEQNEVLDLLRRVKARGLADVLPDAPAQIDRYAASAAADLESAATAGAAFFAEGTTDGSTSEVVDLAQELAGAIVGVVRDRIGRSLSEAGDDPEELADRVRACYREWKTQRIGDTARHFVLAAFSRGIFDAQPAGVCLRWVVDDGGSPCPDAEDNALAGALDRNEPFPTGHHYPPAHPGCRCLVVPVRQ